jgi:hypothetical protein
MSTIVEAPQLVVERRSVRGVAHAEAEHQHAVGIRGREQERQVRERAHIAL